MNKSKINCWEFMKCGREPGGVRAVEFGVCPASTETSLNTMNRGVNAGRTCWLVAGTYCCDELQGTFAEKFEACHECEFFGLVQKQEERHFRVTEDHTAAPKQLA